jgi:hypothetical protein
MHACFEGTVRSVNTLSFCVLYPQKPKSDGRSNPTLIKVLLLLFVWVRWEYKHARFFKKREDVFFMMKKRRGEGEDA